MLLLTVVGALHVLSYKITPMRVELLWFPFGVIADSLVGIFPLSAAVGLVQYPMFAVAFAAGVRRIRCSIALLVLLGIYIGAVCIALAVAK
jgi:hypothetical protein